MSDKSLLSYLNRVVRECKQLIQFHNISYHILLSSRWDDLQKQIKEGVVQARPLTAKALFYAAGASTLLAGILHLAIVPMFFTQMTVDTTIFFIISGLTQIFWVIPVIKRWSKPWYYIGIGGTTILITMYLVAVPGSGYPVSHLDIAIELFQFAFIILCSIIIVKDRTTSKLYKRNI